MEEAISIYCHVYYSNFPGKDRWLSIQSAAKAENNILLTRFMIIFDSAVDVREVVDASTEVELYAPSSDPSRSWDVRRRKDPLTH